MSSKRSIKRSKLRSRRSPSTSECQKCYGDGYIFNKKLLRIRCSCVWRILTSSRKWKRQAKRAK